MDTFRYFHPARPGAFTCWSTVTGARQTNYGTRIDYIFADCELTKQYFVAADIMPEVEGSDHCPVWGQLSCPLLPASKPPPLCTRYLPEFAGKQQKLSRFLVKVEQRPAGSERSDGLPGSQEEGERRENLNPGRKRVLASDSVVPKGKKTKSVKPQGSLLSFFKPKPSDDVFGKDETPPSEPSEIRTRETTSAVTAAEDQGGSSVETRPPKANRGESSVFWRSVLHGPPPPPPCKVHGEPCVLRTVKKEGPNLGRQFFVCARPQGHPSNPEARCDFFSWVEKGK